MTTDLATTGPTALDAILADPDKLRDVPIEVMERLFALQRGARSDQAREAYAVAFHALQGDLTPVRKRAKNSQTGSMYANAEAVNEMLDPVLHNHGFSVSLSSEPCDLPEQLRFVLIVRHVRGHSERHTMDAAVDNIGPKGSPTKTKLHGGASSYTFVGRHLKCNVFNVQLVKDDDGNAGGGIGPSAEKITLDQANELNTIAENVGADKIAFCTYLKVDSITSIPAGRYREAKLALERKRGSE